MGSSFSGRCISVRVPATSANLGAGFDVLGLALDLHNVFTVTQNSATRVSAEGYTEGLSLNPGNLFHRAFCHLYNVASRDAPTINVHMQLMVPPGKGFGSSATAVVGGLVAANAFMGEQFDDTGLLAEAIKLEHGGHADNVAPALMGGLVVNVLDGEHVISLKAPFPDDLSAVVFTPDFSMDTVQGRALMPQSYSKEDVIFNLSRGLLFLTAVQRRRYDLLRIAMQDRLHQPYRTALFPQLPALIDAAVRGGAHGACLSGGGSSVLALVTSDAGHVAECMQNASLAVGIRGDTRILQVAQQGAAVTWLQKEREE